MKAQLASEKEMVQHLREEINTYKEKLFEKLDSTSSSFGRTFEDFLKPISE